MITDHKKLEEVYTLTNEGHYETDDYVFFWNGPFSNWHPAKFDMIIEEQHIKFSSSEQAMMYLKALTFNDPESMALIMETNSAGNQKALGKLVKNFDVAHWSSVCEQLSDTFLYEKFYQNEKLKNILLETGNKILAESSPTDHIWGIGMGVSEYPEILDKNNWKGKNLLGESLMRVREELKNAE